MSADAFDVNSFRAGLASGTILLQKCRMCGRCRIPPLPACPYCGSVSTMVIRATGGGSVYSFVRVHISPSGAFAADTPYTVATITLDEGAKVFARVEGDQITIGDRVRASIIDTPTGAELQFAPIGASS